MIVSIVILQSVKGMELICSK